MPEAKKKEAKPKKDKKRKVCDLEAEEETASGITSPPLFQYDAQNRDLRCVLHPGTLRSRVQHVLHPEQNNLCPVLFMMCVQLPLPLPPPQTQPRLPRNGTRRLTPKAGGSN